MTSTSPFDLLPADVKPEAPAYAGFEHRGALVFSTEYQKLYVETEQALKAKGSLPQAKKVQKRVDKKWLKMHTADENVEAVSKGGREG
ncbi:hypothetical protein JCM9279_005019 [Rhodotorula babjevae]